MSGLDFKLSGLQTSSSSSFSLSGMENAGRSTSGRTPLKEMTVNLLSAQRSNSTARGVDFEKVGSEKSTTLASFLDTDSGGRWSDPSSDELLQARIEHLERERVELSLQIHLRDEKERSRKLKIEQLESQLKLAESSKTEAVAQLEGVKREKESIERRLLDSACGPTKQSSSSAQVGSASIAASIHAMVDSAPPAYLTGTEATQGLWSKMTAASKELRRLEEECRDLKRERDDQTATSTKTMEEVESLKAVIEKGKATLMTLRKEASEAAATIQELEDGNADLSSQLEESRAKESQFLIEIESHAAIVQGMEDRIRILELDLAEARGTIAQIELAKLESERQQLLSLKQGDVMGIDDVSLMDLEGNNPKVLNIIDDLRKRLYESEQKRKKLNNALQDLKGNVRVLVRCRPFLRGDGDNHESSLVCNRDGTSISLVGASRAGQVFSFDTVYNAETSQENVYSSISELVQSAIDGYRVCVFSYGQTGSGKTWTMSGDKFGSQRGIIPRSVEQIIQQSISMRDHGWEMSLSASVVELYNEELRDLLAPKSSHGEDKEKLKISNIQGRVSVSGMTLVDIDNSTVTSGMMQLDQVLETAKRSRVTISTGMNEQSSRSHMLFMLELTGRHKDGTTVTRGGLRLVDLAGSERLDRTGTANDAARLKETVNINKSLSCLADVFTALGNKQQHVPYRNSKLTMLLQDCMSGDGKALMIVNVSPTQASAQETLCSLRFAAQVSQVELGKAQKQMYTIVQAPNLSSKQASTANTVISALPPPPPSVVTVPVTVPAVAMPISAPAASNFAHAPAASAAAAKRTISQSQLVTASVATTASGTGTVSTSVTAPVENAPAAKRTRQSVMYTKGTWR